MKIKKTKKVSNKKIIIALVLVIAILGVAALAYFTWQQNDPANVAETHNNSSSKTGDKKEKKKDSAKDKTNPAVTQKEQNNNTDKPPQPEYNESRKKYQINISASDDDDGTNVNIRGMLMSVVAGGKCWVQLSGPDGESRAVDTQMLSGPTTTYCKTVQFNKASMKKGVWKYTVKYQSDNAEGASSENTFAIK